MKKIKILTISTSGIKIKEGISTIILDFYKLIDKKIFELDIISDGEVNNTLENEFENIGVRIHKLPSRKQQMFKYIISLIKLIKANSYDVLYIHGSSAIMAIELTIAKILGCRVRITHSHNTNTNHVLLDRIMRPLFYSSYSHALACGKEAGKWLYGSRNFDIIKNGRIIENYKYNLIIRKTMRQQLGLEDDVLAIGHVGNFNKQKNQVYIIGIIENLLKYTKNFKIFLIGEGNTKKMVEDEVNNKGYEKYVTFTGSINNVPDMLQAMDVMILPSLHEGLPLVAIEWQIACLPSILSDNITKETSYTDLVKFLPLMNNHNEWAKQILNTSISDRNKKSDEIIELTKQNGFDLKDSVKKLEDYFMRG